MAPRTGSVWAIDIGSNSLKALQLSYTGTGVEVVGFSHIRHTKIFSGTGIQQTEKDELVALSLRQFLQEKPIGKNDVIISVPSQNSFARFVTLPPVEPKRIPEIVKFEAAQQIPFDINDVQWDWQLMTEADSPEVQVGIFAIKNDIVNAELEHFGREEVTISCVQMAPMALYNYVLFDRPELFSSAANATVVLDVGADHTDLVVCTQNSVWQRCIPMGGNTFTKAIAETFKLNFEKAEKLKRTASMSKYARQIFQAMRPVFTDLASEIQRSLGYYSNSNPKMKVTKLIALGGGTNMRGLLKYLQQSLQIPIERPDSFKNLSLSSDQSAAKFHENICDFGIVYGLGLQALGISRIESDLLPRSVARSMIWAKKAKYFTFAACILLVVSLLSFGRTFIDKVNYNGNEKVRKQTKRIISSAEQAKNKLQAEESKATGYEAMIGKEFGLFKNREILPLVHQTLIEILPNEKNNPSQNDLYRSFARNDVESVLKVPRNERKQIFVTNISVQYSEDVGSAGFSGSGFSRRGGFSRGGGQMAPEGAVGPAMGPAMGPSQRQSARSVRYQPRTRSSSRDRTAQANAVQEAEEGRGYVISISGYSPHKNIGELLEPTGVGKNKDRWGLVTRLMNLDEIFDGNSPFKLYKRSDNEHFRLDKGEVDLEETMPSGIGVEDAYKGALVDPMTKEVISKEPVLDEEGNPKTDRRGEIIYKVNDHWFTLDFKLLWNILARVCRRYRTGAQLVPEIIKYTNQHITSTRSYDFVFSQYFQA